MLDAAIALNRFGLGARPSDPLPGDSKGWLLNQFATFEPRPQVIASLPPRGTMVAELLDYGAQTRKDARDRQMMIRAAVAAGSGPPPKAANLRQRELREAFYGNYSQMNAARLDSALTTASPFAERLVHFWANHFAVSLDKPALYVLAGLFEFEAVRPHIFGRFADLLLAAEQHPAMLVYLDQAQSIGPNSQFGQRRQNSRRGINENLAREIMELHTLGVRSGYTQADVTEFARALTGWTVRGVGGGPDSDLTGGTADGDSVFADTLHEPGPRRIMGKAYPQSGQAQSRAILLDLAASPATARHISTKLARHFAGDDPPQAMVDRLSAAYQGSGGDLPSVYRAIIASPEAWKPQPLKFKTPWEWSVSALRAVGETEEEPAAAQALLKQLGQTTWRPGSPAGWEDNAASWAASDVLMLRLQVAQRIANRMGSSVDPRAIAEKVLPGSLGDRTRKAIAMAPSAQDGLALLLVSPEFMRR